MREPNIRHPLRKNELIHSADVRTSDRKLLFDEIIMFIQFGQKMGHGVDTKFYVIEVDIPDYIVDNAFRNPGKHDGIGAASYFEVEDLNQKSVKIKSRNSVRADWKQQVLGRCNG